MRINLFVNVYIDKNLDRQLELERCFSKNIANKLIDRVYALVDHQDYEYWIRKYPTDDNLVYVPINKRPIYNTYFGYTLLYPNDINIISNSDIYFDDSLYFVKDFKWTSNICFALSRWDWHPSDPSKNLHERLIHLPNPDSQDSWIFFGKVNQLPNANFCLGTRGCDNSIAHQLTENVYKVINPSKSIVSVHVHNSNIRNYSTIENKDLVPPPYLCIHSSYIDQI